MHIILFYNKFISCLCMFRTHLLTIRRSKLHYTASGIITTIDDTRGCVRQLWPPDDEHMCSKHVEAWNKHIVKQFCASSWLNTEINILRCTVSKTSKFCASSWLNTEINILRCTVSKTSNKNIQFLSHTHTQIYIYRCHLRILGTKTMTWSNSYWGATIWGRR